MGPESSGRVVIRKRRFGQRGTRDTQTQRRRLCDSGGGDGSDAAAKTKEHPALRTTSSKQEEARKASSLRDFRGSTALLTP